MTDNMMHDCNITCKKKYTNKVMSLTQYPSIHKDVTSQFLDFSDITAVRSTSKDLQNTPFVRTDNDCTTKGFGYMYTGCPYTGGAALDGSDPVLKRCSKLCGKRWPEWLKSFIDVVLWLNNSSFEIILNVINNPDSQNPESVLAGYLVNQDIYTRGNYKESYQIHLAQQYCADIKSGRFEDGFNIRELKRTELYPELKKCIDIVFRESHQDKIYMSLKTYKSTIPYTDKQETFRKLFKHVYVKGEIVPARRKSQFRLISILEKPSVDNEEDIKEDTKQDTIEDDPNAYRFDLPTTPVDTSLENPSYWRNLQLTQVPDAAVKKAKQEDIDVEDLD